MSKIECAELVQDPAKVTPEISTINSLAILATFSGNVIEFKLIIPFSLMFVDLWFSMI